jgi:hypothetical protein
MRHLIRRAEVVIVLVGAATLANLIVLAVGWR